jgi:hypothetical protein
MESDYGQFVYLDENNNFECENTKDCIIIKENRNSFKTNNFNGSLIILFMQYVCNLVEYFYRK